MQDFEMLSDQDFLPYIEKHITNPLIQKVLSNLLQYYTRTATLCRKYYYLSAALTIVLPTLVTIVSSLSGVWDMQFINVFTAVVAGLSAVISGFTSLFKWQENWLRFRMGVEDLKKESINYIAQIGKYSDANRDAIFLSMMQKIINDMNVKDLLYYGKASDLSKNKEEISKSLQEETKDVQL